MKQLKLLSLMFFLLPKINAQITGEVLNLHSKEKIAYVWKNDKTGKPLKMNLKINI